jgi:hypothetical protein
MRRILAWAFGALALLIGAAYIHTYIVHHKAMRPPVSLLEAGQGFGGRAWEILQSAPFRPATIIISV